VLRASGAQRLAVGGDATSAPWTARRRDGPRRPRLFSAEGRRHDQGARPGRPDPWSPPSLHTTRSAPGPSVPTGSKVLSAVERSGLSVREIAEAPSCLPP